MIRKSCLQLQAVSCGADSPDVAPSRAPTYGSSNVLSVSSSIGDEGFSYPAAPGKPGSGSVSASEVTSGAGAAGVDSTSTGAGICTGGRIVIGLGKALGVVLTADPVSADAESLGIEFARLGAALCLWSWRPMVET